ncbi:MAG: peptidase M61 [Burkholderiales bacterium]
MTKKSSVKVAKGSSAQPTPVALKVEIADLHAHLYRVSMTVARPAAQQILALPVWIPGSYLVREFSKNLQRLTAWQGRRQVALAQLDKHRWHADCDPAKPLLLTWEVHALDPSVRTAWLDAGRGFFNGTSLFLAVEGQQDVPHRLEITSRGVPADWQVATALSPIKLDGAGFGTYEAANYDELIDSPVELGNFWSGEFRARGVPHHFVVAGAAPTFDGKRLLADTQKICETQINFWHEGKKPPHRHYLFLLNAVDDGYGGLEHRHSTALICKRSDLPRLEDARNAVPAQSKAAQVNASIDRVKSAAAGPGDGALNTALDAARAPVAAPQRSEGYRTLLGLISHEYFHTWNVKRLRPAEFARYDYWRENYTELLWLFEGFTSYYDDLLLRRAGLLSDEAYLKLLNKNINQVRQTPGRLVQSVAQSSFDAWVKYYRPDENTPNATVSYYTKGALVALCLDLTLRAEGAATLDDVMRALFARPASRNGRSKADPGGPISEADFASVLEQEGGRSFAAELAAWVHGTGELPLADLLGQHGVEVHDDPSQLAQRIGVRVAEGTGVRVKTVLRGGAAERAGIAAGDEWIGVEISADAKRSAPARRAGHGSGGSAWRLAKLDDLLLYAGAESAVIAIVARDQRLLHLPLELPKGESTWRLSFADSARSRKWLSGRR